MSCMRSESEFPTNACQDRPSPLHAPTDSSPAPCTAPTAPAPPHASPASSPASHTNHCRRSRVHDTSGGRHSRPRVRPHTRIALRNRDRGGRFRPRLRKCSSSTGIQYYPGKRDHNTRKDHIKGILPYSYSTHTILMLSY